MIIVGAGSQYNMNMNRMDAQRHPMITFNDIIIDTKAQDEDSYPRIEKLGVYQYQIHHICVGGMLYDDNKVLVKHNCAKYKISKVTIGTYRNYVSCLQFSYLNFETGKEIDGHAMGKRWMALSNLKTLKLKEDEYLTGWTARTGLIVDRLGVLTTHGGDLIVGGNGGIPIVFTGEPGYHVGAVSASIHFALTGLQFNLIPIPTKIEEEKKVEPFIFFESERLFGFAIKYLSLRETMHLFLVSRKVAQYRIISEAFWMKCLSVCDPLALLYLKNIASQYKNPDLLEILRLHEWRHLPLQIGQRSDFGSFLSIQLITKTLFEIIKPNTLYVLVVGLRASNQTFQYKIKQFKFFEIAQNFLFESKLSDEFKRNLDKCRVPVLTRKISFAFKVNEGQLLDLVASMENWLFLTQSQKNDIYYFAWIIDYFCMMTECKQQQVNFSSFEKLQIYENVWINAKHKPIFNDRE